MESRSETIDNLYIDNNGLIMIMSLIIKDMVLLFFAGIDNNINGVQNDANDCWRLVKQCEWVTYKTVCANKPVNVCKVSKIKTFDELMM